MTPCECAHNKTVSIIELKGKFEHKILSAKIQKASRENIFRSSSRNFFKPNEAPMVEIIAKGNRFGFFRF